MIACILIFIQVLIPRVSSASEICEKRYFLQRFVNTGKRLQAADIKRIQSECTFKLKCDKGVLAYHWMKNEKNETHIAVAALQLNGKNNEDCWGFYFEMVSSDEKTNITRYLNFNTTQKQVDFLQRYRLTRYTVKLIAIPSMQARQVQLFNQDWCEEKVLKIIHQAPRFDLMASNQCGKKQVNLEENRLKIREKLKKFHNSFCQLFPFAAANVCNKSRFIERYVEKSNNFNLNKSESKLFQKQCKPVTKCDAADLSITYTKDLNHTYQFLLKTEELLAKKNSECWGYVLIVSATEENYKKVYYLNFKNVKKNDYTLFLPERNYNVSVIAVPSMLKKFINNVPKPDACERDLLEDIKSRQDAGQCSSVSDETLDYKQIMNDFAHPMCSMYPDKQKRKERINDYFANEKSPCKFNFRPLLQQKKSVNSLLVALVVLSTIVFIIIVIFICQRLYKWKKKRALPFLDESSNENLVPLREKRRSSVQPMVMILSRPGCELLEWLLRDLAHILSSYNIEAKLALLDQHEVDIEGGISSYMQRNISRCDYILIMFTEQYSKDQLLPKHKPYEFALRVISGLAYHNNSCSRYIPMYLTSYNDAVNLLPSFLNASTSFGYQIPKDVNKLLYRILETDKLDQSTERRVKDNFFISRMRSNAKLILEGRHNTCCSNYCTKGELYDSVSNLSSIWPSTKNSTSPLHGGTDRMSTSSPIKVSKSHGIVNTVMNNFTNVKNSSISITQIVNNHINSSKEPETNHPKADGTYQRICVM